LHNFKSHIAKFVQEFVSEAFSTVLPDEKSISLSETAVVFPVLGATFAKVESVELSGHTASSAFTIASDSAPEVKCLAAFTKVSSSWKLQQVKRGV
jgi:hypothetical protein